MKNILKQFAERLLYGKLSLVLAAIIFICTGSSYFLRKPISATYPPEPISADHLQTEQYIRNIMSEYYHGLTGDRRILDRIPTVPVVSAEDFPQVERRIETLLHQSWRSNIDHIVIGCLQPMALDAPLLAACDQPRLLEHIARKNKCRLTLYILAPATISRESQTELEAKGVFVKRFPF